VTDFSALGMGLGSIYRLSSAKTRLITAENVYGEKGRGGMAELTSIPQSEVVKIGQKWDGPNSCARELGTKWKVRPCITLPSGQTTTIMDVDGPGCIQHIWITLADARYRDQIIRIYWDNETEPSVECPVGDLFCCGFNARTKITALPINVNPSGGFNSYFPMPFRMHARITVENRHVEALGGFFYAVTFTETEVPDDAAYFHAQFRRTNPLPYGEDYLIVDNITGHGHYVGTYMAWQQNSTGWWGEGEIKFFLDGDMEYPTLCGTGTEDYFGGAWGFGDTFTGPYLGYPYGDTTGRVGSRHGLYRFHIMDPIRFETDLKVTMQAIGWRSEGRYLPLQDDIASVAYWYQAEPHGAFPALGDRNALEVI
jgi:hypothetical protein